MGNKLIKKSKWLISLKLFSLLLSSLLLKLFKSKVNHQLIHQSQLMPPVLLTIVKPQRIAEVPSKLDTHADGIKDISVPWREDVSQLDSAERILLKEKMVPLWSAQMLLYEHNK